MKRELAFALEARSLILDSVGKTRSNRAPSVRSNGVSGSGRRKRVKRSAGEEPLKLEIEGLGVRSSVCDEIKEDLVENDVGSRSAVFDDLVEHDSVQIDSKDVVSGLNNGLLERECEAEVEITAIDEPESRRNGDLGVEGRHCEKTPAVVEIRECEMEVETVVVGSPISKNCSVHVEEACCLINGNDGVKEDLRDQFAGNSNADTGEKLHGIEPVNGVSMDESSVKKEVPLVNGNMKAPAEKPQRRFTRSVLKVNDKDPIVPLDMETNMIAKEDKENLEGVNLNHSSEVVTVDNEEFNEGSIVDGSKLESPKKLEVEDLKETSITKIPKSVKELLETGILEGCKVFYNGGKQGPGVRGIIKGAGILCSCDLCRGSRVVLPSQFEIHAFKSYRRAAQYICLENGRSFIDILQLCRGIERKKLETTIRNAIGPLTQKQMVVCRDCKDRDPLCKSCTKKLLPSDSLQATTCNMRGPPKPASTLKSSGDTSAYNSLRSRGHGINRLPQKVSSNSSTSIQMAKVSVGKAKARRKFKESASKLSTPKTSPGPGRKTSARLNKSNQARTSCKSPSLKGSSQRKAGKITRKDLKMHRLVFDDDGLPDGTELAYYARGEKILEGYKMDAGIYCRCCNEVVSASQFEAHAGFATRRKPYSFIYTSNGVSLHELAVSMLKSSRRAVEDSDDLCIICADGGELLLCDGCPRAFHKECASLTHHPRGDWFCRYCESAFERDKYVEWNANAVAAGRVTGVDPIKQISNRSIRIVKDFQEDATSCYLCREVDFSKSGFGPRTILICDQCEREYHVGCLKKKNMADLEDLPQGEWFCNTNCQMIRSSLQSLLNQGAEKLPNNLLDVIRDKLRAQNTEIPTDFDVSWRLLSGQVSSEDLENTRPLLSQAISILHEGFGTIVDGATGRDLIPSIVYGRKVRNREFRGMYCAVLLVNSLVVSVAVFRLFGQELVELPLVATRGGYCGKGYFQALFGCILRLFAFHRVKSIVLPAAEGAEGVWLKLGFKRMDPDQVSECKKTFWQITQFAGVLMLEKQVLDCRVVNPSENASENGTCA